MDQTDDSSHDPWLADYDDHLQRVVGAAPATRQRYGTTVRRFLSSCFGTGTPDWAILSVETVVDFIRQGPTTRFVRSCSRAEQAANIAPHCPPKGPLMAILDCVREAWSSTAIRTG